MLPEDGANDAQTFRSQRKTTFLCVKCAFVDVTNEYICVFC